MNLTNSFVSSRKVPLSAMGHLRVQSANTNAYNVKQSNILSSAESARAGSQLSSKYKYESHKAAINFKTYQIERLEEQQRKLKEFNEEIQCK